MDKNLEKAIIKVNKSLWDKERVAKVAKEGLYEVWFTMVGDHERGEAYWIRYTLMVPKKKIKVPADQNLDEFIDKLGGDGMLWLGYFNKNDSSKNFIIKKKFPLSAVDGSKVISESKYLIIKIQDAEVYLDRIKGGFETQSGKKIKWELEFSHFMEPYVGTPDIAKKIGLTNSLAKATHPNLRISGNITINGDSKEIKNASGIHYHTYGTGYLVPWEWFSAHTIENSPDGYADLGYKVEKGVIEVFDGEKTLTPWNQKFTKKVKVMKKIKRERSLTNLSFSVEHDNIALEGEVSVPMDALVGVEYFGPLGNSFYCYNSEIADLKLIVKISDKEGNLIEEKELIAEKSVSFETVYDTPQEGIKYLPYDKEEL